MGELVKITGVAEFQRASKAKGTQTGYAGDLRQFVRWCSAAAPEHLRSSSPLPAPPETVATYFAAMAATHKFATIARHAAALAFAHRAAGFDNPLANPGVKQTLEGIARTLGRAPVKKAALTAELLAKAVRKIPVERRAVDLYVNRRSPARAAIGSKSPVNAVFGNNFGNKKPILNAEKCLDAPAPALSADDAPTPSGAWRAAQPQLPRPPAPDLAGPDSRLEPQIEPDLPGGDRPAGAAHVPPNVRPKARGIEGKHETVDRDVQAHFLVPDLAGLRDRALLLLGFAGALRRSELIALNVADVSRHRQGALIIVRRGKTDQTGQGLTKAVPHGKKLKAIEALDAWLAAAGITEGPIFRAVHGTTVLEHRLTAGQVARIIKKRCAAIGLDPKLFSGHSLRSGFITSAAEHGASLSKIADQAGHSKLDTTRAYVQVQDAFRDHSGRKFL